MKKLTVRQIAFDAVLAALYFALSFASVKLGNMKLTLDGLPILVGAVLFGPVDGLLVAAVGGFLDQLVSYGLTATTFLWLVPGMARGLLVGWYSKKHGFAPGRGQLMFITIVSALLVTALTTGVMYVDSRLYGYYSRAFVFGMLLPRIAAGVLTSVFFALILPPLLALIKKNVRL